MTKKKYNFYSITNYFEQSELHGRYIRSAEHNKFDQTYKVSSFKKLENFGKKFEIRHKGNNAR